MLEFVSLGNYLYRIYLPANDSPPWGMYWGGSNASYGSWLNPTVFSDSDLSDPISTNYQPTMDNCTGILTTAYRQGLAHPLYTNIHYQVTLQKIGATNDLYTSTNIEHRVIGYYAYSTRDTWGATNEYTNQGLSLIESNWNGYYSNGWAWGSINPGWFAGDRTQIETPPASPPEINTTTNIVTGTSSRGFVVGPQIKSVSEWNFLYTTNKFW